MTIHKKFIQIWEGELTAQELTAISNFPVYIRRDALIGQFLYSDSPEIPEIPEIATYKKALPVRALSIVVNVTDLVCSRRQIIYALKLAIDYANRMEAVLATGGFLE